MKRIVVPTSRREINQKALAKPNSCAYTRNRSVSRTKNPMRRDVFQAIADPTRRAIIALIALQAMTPNAIAEHFETSRQAVSKHLRILTECDLVTQEQKGREIYYRLEIEKMIEIDKWLEHVQEIWEGNFKRLDALLAELKQQETQERKK